MADMFNIGSFFAKKPQPAKKFELCAISVLERHVSSRKEVAGELEEARDLVLSAAPDEERQKIAARIYFALENHISREQPRNRVPAETLREQVLHKCHPDSALGDLAIFFLSSDERRVKLLERFAETVLEKVPGTVEGEERGEIYRILESDGQLQGIFKDGKFFWGNLPQKIRKLGLADRAVFIQTFLKRALGILAQRVSIAVGEIRTELMFGNAYREFRENLNFIDDVPKVLLIAPDAFLEDERTALMEKTELEKELRRKQQALESAAAELQEEKTKLSSLSREELEKRVEKRTAELARALDDAKVSRAKLEEAKGKDEAFLENISDGLVAIDRAGNIILWNKAASAISEWTREEVSGRSFRNFLKFVRERDKREYVSFIEDATLSGKAARAEEETSLVTKYGKSVAVGVGASPVVGEKGRVSSTIIIFRDISSERELQKTREEFASLSAHELRTPVAAIGGYVNLLLGGSVGPLAVKQKEYLEEVGRADGRLLTLINAMLNVSRIELGTLAIEPEPTYLPDMADAVLDELSLEIKNKKLAVARDYDRHVPIIDLDRSLIHAIFQNLFSNAVKYTPDGGKIVVAMEKRESSVIAEVSDTGCGIPKKQQPKIFGKLFRADNARAKVPDGTGLGLYIVKSVLDQTGGEIWFESEENKGTSFYFTVPLRGMAKKEGIRGLS